MSNFGLNVPQYNGPQYYEVQEQMKKEAPGAYNRLQANIAKNRTPNSEVVRYTNAEGKEATSTNIGAGYLSGTDPVARDIVAGVVLNKPLQWVGSKVINAGKKVLGKNESVSYMTEEEFGELFDKIFGPRLSQDEKIKYVGQASREFFDYIGSERHLEQIMRSGKKSRQDAQRIARAMKNNAAWSNIGMSPDYTEFVNLPRNVAGATRIGIGPSFDPTLSAIPDIRIGINKRLNDVGKIQEAVQHELGHASTLGYNPAATNKRLNLIKEQFSPEVKEIYAHNSQLRPRRRKKYMNIGDQNPELEKMLQYLEGVDEYSTRARNILVSTDNSDLDPYFKYFDNRTVNRLLHNVWGLAPVIGVASSVIDNE